MTAAEIINDVQRERRFLLRCGYDPQDFECHLSHDEWMEVRRNWAFYEQVFSAPEQARDTFFGMPVTLHDRRSNGLVRLRIGTPPARSFNS